MYLQRFYNLSLGKNLTSILSCFRYMTSELEFLPSVRVLEHLTMTRKQNAMHLGVVSWQHFQSPCK